MSVPHVDARVIVRPATEHAYLPEGPRVLPDGRLLWLTIQCGKDGDAARQGAIHVLDLEHGTGNAMPLPGRPGFALPSDSPAVVLLGMERAVGWLDLDSGSFEPLVQDLDAHCTGTIVNDAEACSHGIVFGMKDTAFRDAKAGLYFLRQRDGRLFQLRDDQLCSNGKVLRELADGRVQLFDIDSPTRLVRRYELDVERGRLGPPEVVLDLTAERAVPDGMIEVPGSGEVIVAMFDPEPAPFGRALRCCLLTGNVLGEYRTPGAAQVTCPAWLDSQEGSFVLLTTARENLSPTQLEQQPDAGCLFVASAALR